MMSSIELIHGKWQDCIDKIGEIDLILTDPPYGIGVDTSMAKNSGQWNSTAPKGTYVDYGWDKLIPDEEMDRIVASAKKAIVWGGNYYRLPPSSSWIVWDKVTGNNCFADCELAWSNLGYAVRMITHEWHGFKRVGSEPRFHPTQKPIGVIGFCLDLYIKKYGIPKLVFDPFSGSGTTLAACKLRGVNCVGTEMVEEYYKKAQLRLSQGELFSLRTIGVNE